MKPIEINEFNTIVAMEQQYALSRDICFKLSSQSIADCLYQDCSLGIYEDGKLIAYCLSTYTNYGTAYIRKVFVLPEHRGKKLSVSLLKGVINKLIDKSVTDIYAMVSPKNIYSFNNAKAVGFEIYNLNKINNVDRYILKLEIQQNKNLK